MATSPITKPLENIETKYIRIIGVPLDLGQSRRGVDMGPSAMRVAGLEAKLEALGYDVEDGGNVPVAMLETEAEGDPHAKYLDEMTALGQKRLLVNRRVNVDQGVERARFLVVLNDLLDLYHRVYLRGTALSRLAGS